MPERGVEDVPFVETLRLLLVVRHAVGMLPTAVFSAGERDEEMYHVRGYNPAAGSTRIGL